MRVHDLYGDLFENAPSVGAVVAGLPPSFQHSMPATHAFPDIDNYYGFYRFVIAMAGEPGEPGESIIPLQSNMRDIPVAVAYTKQEHDMIHRTARRMGSKAIELAYQGSQEQPDTYTKSPVMKFSMPESSMAKLRGLIQLSEAMTHATL